MKKKEVTANFIQRDLTLVLKCEWGECTHMSETMEDFIAHVRVHIRQAIEQHSTHQSGKWLYEGRDPNIKNLNWLKMSVNN